MSAEAGEWKELHVWCLMVALKARMLMCCQKMLNHERVTLSAQQAAAAASAHAPPCDEDEADKAKVAQAFRASLAVMSRLSGRLGSMEDSLRASNDKALKFINKSSKSLAAMRKKLGKGAGVEAGVGVEAAVGTPSISRAAAHNDMQQRHEKQEEQEEEQPEQQHVAKRRGGDGSGEGEGDRGREGGEARAQVGAVGGFCVCVCVCV